VPLTSDITDLLLGEIRQTGTVKALSSAVVCDPPFHLWWVVSCSAEDGMSVQSELKHQQLMKLVRNFTHTPSKLGIVYHTISTKKIAYLNNCLNVYIFKIVSESTLTLLGVFLK
jgi:hypothetical protein